MLCKNCNYILTGKENFCPNCGEALEDRAMLFAGRKDKREKQMEKEDGPKVPVSLEGMIFDESEPLETVAESLEEKTQVTETTEKNGKKSRKGTTAGKILVLIILCCTLAVTAFGLADYFGIRPELAGLVNSFSVKKQTTQGNVQRDFIHGDTIVAPDREYRDQTAYVFSGEGLILRKGPANSFAPLHSLTDLTQVSILGGSLASPEWVYVYCAEKDSYGWVDGSFLCSDVIAESLISEQNVSVEDIPTAYYSQGYDV